MNKLAKEFAPQSPLIAGWSEEVVDDILLRASDGGTVSVEITGLSEVHTFNGKSLIGGHDHKGIRQTKAERSKILEADAFARFDINFGGRLERTHEICEGSITSLHYEDDECLFKRGIIGEATLDVVRRSQSNPADKPMFTFDLLISSKKRCRELSERLSAALNAGNRVLVRLDFLPPDDLPDVKNKLSNRGSSGTLYVTNFEVDIQVGVWDGRFLKPPSKTA